jgi:hypothetical protein
MSDSQRVKVAGQLRGSDWGVLNMRAFADEWKASYLPPTVRRLPQRIR